MFFKQKTNLTNSPRMSLDPPQTDWPTLDTGLSRRRADIMARHPEWTPLAELRK